MADSPSVLPVDTDVLDRIVDGEHHDPHSVPII